MKPTTKTLGLLFVVATVIVACREFTHEHSLSQAEESIKTRSIGFVPSDYYLYGQEKIPVQKLDGKSYIEFYSADESIIVEKCANNGIKLYDVHQRRDWGSMVAPSKEGSGAKIFTNLSAVITHKMLYL